MVNITPEGGQYILNCLFNGSALPATYYIRLFASATGSTTTRTEAVGGDYAPLALDGSVVIDLVDGIPTAKWGTHTITINGPLTGDTTIYGYQIATGAGETYTALWDELIQPFTPGAGTNRFNLVPQLAVGNGTLKNLTDAGGLRVLQWLFGGEAIPAALKFMLCTSATPFAVSTGAGTETFNTADIGPLYASSSVAVDAGGNYQLAEVIGGGYTAASLTPTAADVSLVSDIPTASWGSQNFTLGYNLNGGMTVKGYQIAVPTDDPEQALFEGLLDVPFTPPAGGGVLGVTPTVQLYNGTVT